jgi:hypothetical protein
VARVSFVTVDVAFEKSSLLFLDLVWDKLVEERMCLDTGDRRNETGIYSSRSSLLFIACQDYLSIKLLV